ncbi:MAG: hypothetical protein SGJ18_02640 [Pseudomonadota bacterium]|nr:hypothetical protein [Pseudomonadota bacterium]
MTFQGCIPSQITLTDGSSAAANIEKLYKLEEKINDILVQDYCSIAGDCEAYPFGSKACGGPKSYIVNSVNNRGSELQTLVEEYNSIEAELNEFSGAISTCEYLMPPQNIKCVQNKCTLD